MLPTAIPRSYYPANFEVLQAWFVVFLHHDALIEAAGLPFYALAVASVYSIARAIGMRRPLATFTALAFAYTPAVVLQSVCAKNDIAMAALYLFVVALIAGFAEEKTGLFRRLVLAVMALGLALGTKPYIVFLAPGFAVFGLWAMWRGRARWRDALPASPAERFLLLYAAVALFLGCYWYVRNAVLFANPFHPIDFRLFGHLVAGTGQGETQQGAFVWSSALASLRELFTNRILDSHAPYNPDLPSMSGWGWFAFACGIPGSAVALFLSRSFRWLAISFCLSLATLFACINPDPWNSRFIIWFPALLTVGFGLTIAAIESPAIRRGIWIVAAASTALNFAGTVSNGYLKPQDWADLADLPVSERSVAVRAGSPYQDILRIVPRGATIAYFVNPNGWVYPLYGADFSRRLQFIPARRGGDFAVEMKRLGLKYFYAGEMDRAWQTNLDVPLSEGRLRQVYEDFYELAE
jgi:hypothetical protein